MEETKNHPRQLPGKHQHPVQRTSQPMELGNLFA
jgi:hypothetical protein